MDRDGAGAAGATRAAPASQRRCAVRPCPRAVGALSRRSCRAPERALGQQPAQPLGFVYARRRHHPTVRATARHARLGGRLRPAARADAPAGTRSRAVVLETGQPLPQDRARPRLPRRRRRHRRSAPRGRRARHVTARFVAVLAGREVATPPGVDPAEFRLAVLEDTYEVVAGLEFVTPVLALTGDDAEGDTDAEAITWPGTKVVHATGLRSLLDALAGLGAEQAAVIAHDA